MPTNNDQSDWYDDSGWENSNDAQRVEFLKNNPQWAQYDENIEANSIMAHDVATQFWMDITTRGGN